LTYELGNIVVKNKLNLIVVVITLFVSGQSVATGWCDLDSGWSVVTNGTKTDEVYLYGKLEEQSSKIWIRLSDGQLGQTNVSLALAASMAGKGISIYIDSAETCESFPSWAPMGSLRHVQII